MPKAEYVEPKTLASLEELLKAPDGEAQQIDYTEDAWSYGAPPPGGKVYVVKLFVDKEGIKEGLEDPKNPKSAYYQFNLIAKINEGEYEGVPIYSKVNTRVYRGKSISTMAGLLAKMLNDPSKIPNPITPKALASLFGRAMLKEPIVKAEVDWRGSYSYKDKDGNDQWENVMKHYTDFPVDPDDTSMRLHIKEVPNKFNGGTAEVRAQAFISRYYGKNESLPTPKVHGANGTAAVPKLVEDSPTLVSVNNIEAASVGVLPDLDMMMD